MAVSVDIVKTTKNNTMYQIVADVTMGDSYPTGGEPINPKQFGLRSIDFLHPANAAGYMFEFDHENQKLLAYEPTSAAAGPATEVADQTDLSTVTVRIIVHGI